MSQFKKPTNSEINNMNNASLKSTLKEVCKRLEDLEKTQQDLETTQTQANDPTINDLLQQILVEVKKFNAERESIKTDLQELRKSNEILLDTVQQQRFLEEVDAEKRAKNLIVLGVSENDFNVNEQTMHTDMDKVGAVLNAIGFREPHNIVSVQRLGKEDPNARRPRPIKVVFTNSEDRQKSMTLQKNLKGTLGGALANVKVKRDTHPAIRKEFGRLFSAEREEKEKPENVGKEVSFDLKRRVLLVDGLVVDRFKPSFF